MNNVQNPIHYEKAISKWDVISTGLFALPLSFVIIFDSGHWFATFIVLMWIGLIAVAVQSTFKSYLVYDSHIEVFNPITKEIKHHIFFEDLHSVRYEDNFGHDESKGTYIMYYPKTGPHHISGIKLILRGRQKMNDVLNLLKFYQTKRIKVFIKTTREDWLKELNLKNWDRF